MIGWKSMHGIRCWHKNGKLHRLSGPAIIRPNGKNEYWIDGNQYSFKQYGCHPLLIIKKLEIL